MFDLFSWFIPSKVEIINANQQNDNLKQVAEQFVNDLDSLSLLLFIIALFVGAIGAFVYYYVLNLYAGRMYKISKWAMVLIITLVVAWVFAVIAGFGIASSELDVSRSIIFRFTIPVFFWTFLFYFATSFFCCNFGKTNAYRFLALRK